MEGGGEGEGAHPEGEVCMKTVSLEAEM